MGHSEAGYVLFISDMHLDSSRPAITRLFIDYLKAHAPQADALYLLGDVFEVWLGDKLSLREHHAVIAELRALSDGGLPIYVMRGNRDFLYGKRFESATGAVLLDDPTVIDLFGTPTLLSHGDILCTDDINYQKYRRIISNKAVQWLAVYGIPDSYKQRIANKMRAASKRAQSQKQSDIMDVNEAAVRSWFEQYQVPQMIHGHTHRPGKHEYTVNGQTSLRWVLGDWYHQGSVLKVSADGEFDLQQLALSTG